MEFEPFESNKVEDLYLYVIVIGVVVSAPDNYKNILEAN